MVWFHQYVDDFSLRKCAFVQGRSGKRGVKPRDRADRLTSARRRSAEEYVSEDWVAVANAIKERVNELGWRQRELAQRSHVSQAIVRELQHHTVERRRSARTLEALSIALGWHPQHLVAVLNGRTPLERGEPIIDNGSAVSSRLDAIDEHLGEITDLLHEMNTNLTTVISQVRTDR
jgi:transcriptional regulator with XRE-family HTH domain